jgi:trehalose 6-phosphate phosphatase
VNPILSDAGRAALDAVARERALIGFDYDGTLAPIVPDRALATLRPETHALLRVTALLYPCVVVSGRSRADLAPRLDGIPLVAFVGNHGAEAGFGPVDRSPRREVTAWRDALEKRLAGLEGVDIEDKGLSLAVHYRRAEDPVAAERSVKEAVAGLPGARIFGGHAVVNAVPESSPTKGEALVELLERTGCRGALYVGDDRTDEDAYLAPGVMVSIHVGLGSSAAGWYLESQADVDGLLRELVAARRRLDGAGARVEGLVKAAGRTDLPPGGGSSRSP